MLSDNNIANAIDTLNGRGTAHYVSREKGNRPGLCGRRWGNQTCFLHKVMPGLSPNGWIWVSQVEGENTSHVSAQCTSKLRNKQHPVWWDCKWFNAATARHELWKLVKTSLRQLNTLESMLTPLNLAYRW